MKYVVLLKSLKAENEQIVLAEHGTREGAEQSRKNWRRVLGGKNWTVDRRPGLDSLDHIVLKVEHRA